MCLHLAATHNDAPMIEILIKNHARAVTQDKNGKTAVELAYKKKNLGMLQGN